MVKEIDWQTKIIKRIRKEGGYAKKWATQLSVGVPDLVTVLYPSGPAFIEVKLEKNWNKNTKRTIDFTEKQIDELHKIREAYGVAFGLVVVYLAPTNVWLAPVVPPTRRAVLRVTRDELLDQAYLWRSKDNLSDYLADWSQFEC